MDVFCKLGSQLHSLAPCQSREVMRAFKEKDDKAVAALILGRATPGGSTVRWLSLLLARGTFEGDSSNCYRKNLRDTYELRKSLGWLVLIYLQLESRRFHVN